MLWEAEGLESAIVAKGGKSLMCFGDGKVMELELLGDGMLGRCTDILPFNKS